MKSLYESYRGAMAYIEVLLPNGDTSIGSGFHIGDGVFVTARHVVENNKILSIATTEHYYVPDDKGNTTINNDPQKFRSVYPKSLTIKSGPYFHPDKDVDVAALIVNEDDLMSIPLGSHFDDLINDEQFILKEILVLGYPPVPFSSRPTLIAAKGEINGIVDKYNASHPHFIISVMARGGFSGGPCLIEWDFALGVVTESLVSNDSVAEVGYMAVISIEPIYTCLKHHNILPEQQTESKYGL